MVAYTPARLAQVLLASGAAVLYTVPGSTSVIVKQIVIANTGSVTVSVYIRLVSGGGLGTSSNDLLSNVDIPGKSTLVFDLSQVLPTASTVVGYASAASTLVATISGLTFA